ncbi:hypothetical protein X425_01432 [Mycobacterium avium XTB13-223]|nr:hypothetical protein X425_01432 [Mycobacterium avium XTB13-223]
MTYPVPGSFGLIRCAGAASARPSPKTMATSSRERSRSATVWVNNPRMGRISLRGSCMNAATTMPTALPFVRMRESEPATCFLSAASVMYAVKPANSSMSSTTSGSAVLGVCERARPAILRPRLSSSSSKLVSSLAALASVVAMPLNSADPTDTSIPYLRSTANSRTVPALMAGPNPPAMPQKTEPLPAPEHPTVRVCRPATRRVHADPFSRRPTSTPVGSTLVGNAAVSASERHCFITNSTRTVPGPISVERAECAPTASRIAGTAFSRSSTVWPVRVRTVIRRQSPNMLTPRRRG